MHSPRPAPTIDNLVDYEPFVRAIARGLLPNEADVQDIVQETWIRSMNAPPKSSATVKGWLATVVRNIVRDRHRSDGRRRQREEVAARPEGESVEFSANQLEGHRGVVQAVLELDEPYKSVVILAYYQSLSPKQIAARLDRSPGSVRSQLSRAHEHLRTRLDREYGGDRSAWASLLAPLARREQLASSTSLVSALVVKLALAAALIGVTCFGWQLFGSMPAHSQGTPDNVAALAESRTSTQGDEQGLAAPSSPEGGERIASGSRALSVTVQHIGAPVAGAHLWFMDSATALEGGLEHEHMLYLGTLELFSRFASHVITDDTGSANFAWSGKVGSLIVRHNAMQLIHSVAEGSEQQRIVHLESKPTVHVEVTDRLGQPRAGVPVLLRVSTSEQNHFDIDRIWTEERTGRGYFCDYQDRVQFFGTEEGGERFSVRLQVPGYATEQQVLNPLSSSEDAVQLRLEECGPLEIHLVDRQGQLQNIDGIATVYSAGRRATERGLAVRVTAGSARIEHVAVRSELEIEFSSVLDGVEWIFDARGPDGEGETSLVEFKVPDRPFVHARVFDQTQCPLSSTAISLCILNEERRELQRTTVITKPDGGVRVQLAEDIEVGTKVTVEVLRYGLSAWEARASTVRAMHLTSVDMDIGSLTLQPMRSRLFGRVVDPAGKAVVGMNLSVPHDRYRTTSGATTDDEGRFEVMGVFSEQPVLEISGSSEWVLPANATFALGADEQIFVLQRGGSITGNFLLDPSVELSSVRMFVRDESGETRYAQQYVHARDGRFEVSGLTSGIYDLVIQEDLERRAEVGGIRVEQARETTDPRLLDLDLKPKRAQRTLSVVDVDGDSIERFHCYVYVDGKYSSFHSGSQGSVTVAGQESSRCALVIEAQGFVPLITTLSDPQAAIVLMRGLQVSLYASERPALEKGDRSVTLSLKRPLDDKRAPGRNATASLAASIATDGQANVVFPGPGTYTLNYSVHQPAGDGMHMATQDRPAAGIFELEVRTSDAGLGLQIVLPDSFFD